MNAIKSDKQIPINKNPVFTPVLFIRQMNGAHKITDNNKILFLAIEILYVDANFKLKKHYFGKN